MVGSPGNTLSRVVSILSQFCILLLCGCVAQESEVKKAEKDLQQRLSQSLTEQNQLLAHLREKDLPQLRGELEKAMRQSRDFQAKQEELKILLDRAEKLNQEYKAGIPQRLDSLDLIVGKILLRLEEIEKRLQSKETR
jgi:hypothetical protein